MYKILCKKQYKVHFGTERKLHGNGPIFETPFFDVRPGAGSCGALPGIKKNLI